MNLDVFNKYPGLHLEKRIFLTEMNKINWSQLNELVNNADIESSLLSEKYVAWRKLDKVDEGRLIFLGQLVPDDSDVTLFADSYPSNHQYWSPLYPIALKNYPYTGCEIYKANDAELFFLVYDEFGSHVPEKRCRLIQKHLIVI